MRAKGNGFTLLELVIAITLWGVIAIFIFLMLSRWLNTNRQEVARLEEDRRAIEALDHFSRDIRQAKAVLEVSPERTLLWKDEFDSDGTAAQNEIVEYSWSNGEWIRLSNENRIILMKPKNIELGSDTTPPATRHIVIFLEFGEHETRHLGTSASLRSNP